MHEIGEYIIYKNDVCKVLEIKENYLKGRDYYFLAPINDISLKIIIPIDNECIRSLISKDEVINIIKNIPNIENIVINNKTIDNEYKNLLNIGDHESLLKIIRTAYTRNKEREDNNKKVSDRDSNYFKIAEKYLYTEFSVVLGMSYEETKKFVIEEVNKINEDKNVG